MNGSPPRISVAVSWIDDGTPEEPREHKATPRSATVARPAIPTVPEAVKDRPARRNGDTSAFAEAGAAGMAAAQPPTYPARLRAPKLTIAWIDDGSASEPLMAPALESVASGVSPFELIIERPAVDLAVPPHRQRRMNPVETIQTPVAAHPARVWLPMHRVLLAPLQRYYPFAYLAAVGVAELVTGVFDARLGVVIDICILLAILAQTTFATGRAELRFLHALFLAPLLRILSLGPSLFLKDVPLVYWYIILAVPIVVATLQVAHTLGLNRRDLGLIRGSLPTQAIVAFTGFGFGIVEYLILRPHALIPHLSLQTFWWPALMLLIGTGFTEELLFRGVMQSASRGITGRLTILYVSLMFAVLHIGYRSVKDVIFVFLVGLFFSWVVLKTGSILGTTLSHGIANISLYLIVPFLGLSGAGTPHLLSSLPRPAADGAEIVAMAPSSVGSHAWPSQETTNGVLSDGRDHACSRPLTEGCLWPNV
ncbi:MAG: CPBP family intramembrane glutamic endopeptidase [Dehalococcoidia bacterium]